MSATIISLFELIATPDGSVNWPSVTPSSPNLQLYIILERFNCVLAGRRELTVPDVIPPTDGLRFWRFKWFAVWMFCWISWLGVTWFLFSSIVFGSVWWWSLQVELSVDDEEDEELERIVDWGEVRVDAFELVVRRWQFSSVSKTRLESVTFWLPVEFDLFVEAATTEDQMWLLLNLKSSRTCLNLWNLGLPVVVVADYGV